MHKGLNKQEYIRRYILFVIGLFIMSTGVALSTKANLGTTPVSSIPYVLSLALPFTLGQITIVVQLIYIGIEFLLLRKDFHPFNCLQIVVVLIYGYFNDFALLLLRNVNPNTYVTQWICCVLSMMLLAFGLTFEVKAGVLMLAVDALMATISQVFHIEFGKVKIAFDSSQVAIALIFSFLLMHGLYGIREGTIAGAICVGLFIKFYNKVFAKMYVKLGLVPIQDKAK